MKTLIKEASTYLTLEKKSDYQYTDNSPFYDVVGTVFILISVHAPISTHPSRF